MNEEGTVLKAAACLVTIKDNDFDLPRIIVQSTWFTTVTALATVYALFGTEIAQIHASREDDFLIGCVTGTVAGIFFLEIALTLYVRGRKYAGTVMGMANVYDEKSEYDRALEMYGEARAVYEVRGYVGEACTYVQ